jgi:hypothetical protein
MVEDGEVVKLMETEGNFVPNVSCEKDICEKNKRKNTNTTFTAHPYNAS